MELLIGSKRAPVTVIESGSSVSRSTGRELARLTVELQVRGENANAEVEETLKGGHAVLVGLGVSTKTETRFRVADRSSRYNNDKPSEWAHVIELEETEEVNAEEVRFAGLNLRPYFYEEDTSDGVLLVRLKAIITPEEQDHIFAMAQSRAYHDVVRLGVSEIAESMRLGRTLWSRDGDRVRQEVNLVDRAWDEKGESSGGWMYRLSEPFQSRAKEQLALQSERIERLIDALLEAGSLTQAQAHAVLDVPEDALERRGREYLRVEDLDALPD